MKRTSQRVSYQEGFCQFNSSVQTKTLSMRRLGGSSCLKTKGRSVMVLLIPQTTNPLPQSSTNESPQGLEAGNESAGSLGSKHT